YKVMAYNVFMMPIVLKGMGTPLLANLNLAGRARLIGEADFLKGQDAIIFNEAFTPETGIIKDALEQEYPFQTPVLGESREGWSDSDYAGHLRPLKPIPAILAGGGDVLLKLGPSPFAAMNGGVFIASRH